MAGNKSIPAMKNRIGRWRTWDFKSPGASTERNFHAAFSQLDILKSSLLGLPTRLYRKVVYLYKKNTERGMVKRKNNEKGVLAVT